MKISSLGYVCIDSPDAKEWTTFGPEVLGMALSDDPLGRSDTVALTVDDRPGRLQVSHGDAHRLTRVGWEVPNAAALRAAVDELTAAGVVVEPGDDEQRRRAQVRDLVSYLDPAGIRHELFWGQLVVPGSFRPGRAMSGFVTAGQGLGHIVLVVPDLEQALAFYTSVLGFTVSDEIDFDGNRVVFFHVNPRHHSLALMGMPGVRGLHHLMVQTNSLDDVGVAHDLCHDRGHPLAMTLGRHTNDHMVSFYVRSPSGFEVEYGWGASTVDDEDAWTVTHMSTISIWGHRPGGAPDPECVEPVEQGAPA